MHAVQRHGHAALIREVRVWQTSLWQCMGCGTPHVTAALRGS